MSAFLSFLLNYFLTNPEAAVALFLAAMKLFDALKNKSKEKALEAAVDVTKVLAGKELGNQEKRKQAIDFVFNKLTFIDKKLLKQSDVEQAVEIAWKVMVKPSL